MDSLKKKKTPTLKNSHSPILSLREEVNRGMCLSGATVQDPNVACTSLETLVPDGPLNLELKLICINFRCERCEQITATK